MIDEAQIKSDKRKASDWAESHKTSQSHATIAKNDTFGLFCCPSLCLFGILEHNPKLALMGLKICVTFKLNWSTIFFL